VSQFAPRKILTKPVLTQAPDPNAGFGMLADDMNKLAQDTKIMGKVNAAHRVAFTSKFPDQLEHCLRLTMERLQAGLDKRGNVVLSDSTTWHISAEEIRQLSEAAYYMNMIKRSFDR
jgi:hypothetical protein